MQIRLGPWSRWMGLCALILVGMLLVELDRGRHNFEFKLPVVLTLAPLKNLAVDSIEITAFDWKSNPCSVEFVGGRWTAPLMFTKSLRLSLPRSVDQEIDSVCISIGSYCFAVPMAQVRSGWLISSSDTTRAVYSSPPWISSPRSSIPSLGAVINWPGDVREISRIVLSVAWKTALCILFVGLSLLIIPFHGADAASGMKDHLYTGRVLLLCLAFGFVYAAIFFRMISYDDTANPRGDAWEYQSMAVNTAAGHGLNRVGIVEPFESYRFRNDAWDPVDYRTYHVPPRGRFNDFRTPGYPLVLAGIYMAFGVSPQKAKQAQLLFLIIIAAFLPYLGFVSWRSIGLCGGIIAGFFFLNRWYPIADVLYTECLVALTVFLLLLIFYFYEKRKTAFRVAVLGFASGTAMLIKGDLIFIPLLVFLWLGVLAWQRQVSAAHAVVFAIICLSSIMPWSIYASTNSGRFIVLSTQAKSVLLEGNNELTWTGGGWHKEYKENPDAFYNRPEIKGLPALLQVARFYLAYPAQIPNVIGQKLTWGFSRFPFLRLTVLLIFLHLWAILDSATRGRMTAGRGRQIASYTVVSIALLAALANIPLMFLVLCSAVGFVGMKGWLGRLPFPLSFTIVFSNFVLVTLVTFGEARFISVMDFLFMLTGTTLLIQVLVRLTQARLASLPASDTSQPITGDPPDLQYPQGPRRSVKDT